MEEIKLGIKLNEEFTKSIKEVTEEEQKEYEIEMEKNIYSILFTNEEFIKEYMDFSIGKLEKAKSQKGILIPEINTFEEFEKWLNR